MAAPAPPAAAAAPNAAGIDLSTVPDDVVVSILGMLARVDPEALVCMTMVSKRFLTLSRAYDEGVWRVACEASGEWSHEDMGDHTPRSWYLTHCRHVRLWQQEHTQTNLDGHRSGVIGVHVPIPRRAFSFEKGRLQWDAHCIVTASSPPHNEIRVWTRAATGKWGYHHSVQLTNLYRNWGAVSFAPDNSAIAVAQEKTVVLYDLLQGPRAAFTDAESTVTCLHLSTGVLACGGYDRKLRVYSASDCLLLREFDTHGSTVWCTHVNPETNIVLSGDDDGNAVAHDYAAGVVQCRMTGHTDTVICIHMMDDHRTAVTGSYDHTVRLWNCVDGSPLRVLQGHSQVVLSVSSYSTIIASGGRDGTIRLWDSATGKEIVQLPTSQMDVKALKLGRGRVIAGSFHSEVSIYEVGHAPVWIEPGSHREGCSVM